MICILLVAGHGTVLETQIKNDDTGLYNYLTGVPKALLPGIGGKKILDFWWETVNMRQLFTEVYLVTNADKYKHFERWATANDFPVENIINDGSTTLEDRLGAVADLELAIRSRKLQDDVMVIAGDMLCADHNFDIGQVIRFFRSKPGELIIFYKMEESEKSSSRGIVEVCRDSNRITRFLEKPDEGRTSSRFASVVFYCIQKDTLPYLSDFLSLQTKAPDRSFGKFWERLINENLLEVFGMKLPTGFQLIGQVGLSDYTKWLTCFAIKQEDKSARPITFRSYARVGLMGNPSDGFNGKTIAMSISNFWAEVTLIESQTLDLPKPIRANFILNVETDELFITAGLQDRVVQVYEGLIYMDFSKKLMEEKGYGNYISMDMCGLPPFWLAYLSDPSDSGRIHSNIRQRWLSGEPLVVEAMETFAQLTDQARVALTDRNWNRLAQLMDQNFELRRSVYSDECLGLGNLKMVELAKQFGSAVKLPGSGGAVFGLCLDPTKLVEMRQAFQEAGCVFCVISPYNPTTSTVSNQLSTHSAPKTQVLVM
ncbi:glucuronokinase with putative uridyl pyrophosphorylase isoform X3 [Nerophis lumbriciformis]|uniref:glucuronokinase with putative uridyl pyrophosphorylase isoform X3 n=1 Tax=Nerophis lumbriciformis TaxID=546530 RepID=UPI002AE05594|nr:uncharacterized protein LOC133572669 isoform X3 [Nerophis lumbriciformis]